VKYTSSSPSVGAINLFFNVGASEASTSLPVETILFSHGESLIQKLIHNLEIMLREKYYCTHHDRRWASLTSVSFSYGRILFK
jgi:hypothetical protein